MSMQAGQTIAGKYRLNHLLGTGGMAAVWSATNVFTDRQFAIKFMLPQTARTPESARRFMLEAKAPSRINHPNIIEVIDVGQTDDGAPFLVMELLTGMSLESAMRQQRPPMTVYELAVVMLDVARAMRSAHKNGVIHRDLKPMNIFLHKDRHGIAIPKILDFGVSKFLDDERSANRGLTMEGTVLGSPMYMSPEQAQGASGIDGRTDVFAFGSILFEGLAGFRCYDAPNFNALIIKVATTKPLDIDESAPDMPESLRSLVRSCLVVDRNKRMASFDEIVDHLGLAIADLEGTTQRIPIHREAIAEEAPSEARLTSVRPGEYRPGDLPASSHAPWMGSGAATMTEHVHPSMAPPRLTAPGTRGMRAFAVAGVMGFTVVAGIALVARRHGNDRPKPPATLASASPPVNAVPPIASSDADAAAASDADAAAVDASTPTISVDTLPVVSSHPPDKPAGQKGKIYAYMPQGAGWCTLSVDGLSKGPTPLTIELPAGTHTLHCETNAGRARTATVVVTEGATVSKRFSF